MRRILAVAASLLMLPRPVSAGEPGCPVEPDHEREQLDYDLAWTPFFVELDDVTHAAGPAAAVPVGADGVSGYRVENVVRLRLRVLDDEGREPDRPLTLRIGVTGERHGQVRMAGSASWCDVLTLTWEKDSTGRVRPPDVLEYRLGTLAAPAGWLPDRDVPRRAAPLWKVTEHLQVSLRSLESNPTDSFNRVVVVRPEAGPPARFEWGTAYPPPSHFLEVHALNGRSGGVNAVSRRRLYYLADRHGNRTVPLGEGFRLTVTSPLPTVGGRLVPERVDVDAAPGLYTLELGWERAADGTWPTGAVALRLLAEGASERPIEGALGVDFARGPVRTVQVWPGFEPEDALTRDVLEVRPGAPRVREGAEGQPAAVPGDAILLRTPLLFFSGEDVPRPASDPRAARERIARNVPELFDVWLEDERAQRATDAELVVSPCPRREGKRCRLASLTSREGLITGVNPSRGYLGLMVRRAPTRSGRYYVRLAASGRSRSRHSWRLEGTREPLHEEALLAVRVRGSDFLAEDLDHASLLVDHVLRGFLAVPAPDQTSDVLCAYGSSRYPDGRYLTAESLIRLRRLGDSSTFVGSLVLVGERYRSARIHGANGPILASPFQGRLEARLEASPDAALSAALADAYSCISDVARLYREASGRAEAGRLTSSRCGVHPESVLDGGRLVSPCLEEARRLARIFPGSDSLAQMERDDAIDRQTRSFSHASGLLGWAQHATHESGGRVPPDVAAVAAFVASKHRNDISLEDGWGTPLRYSVLSDGRTLRVQSAGGDYRFEAVSGSEPAPSSDPSDDLVIELTTSPQAWPERTPIRHYHEVRPSSWMTDLGPALRELREARGAQDP